MMNLKRKNAFVFIPTIIVGVMLLGLFIGLFFTNLDLPTSSEESDLSNVDLAALNYWEGELTMINETDLNIEFDEDRIRYLAYLLEEYYPNCSLSERPLVYISGIIESKYVGLASIEFRDGRKAQVIRVDPIKLASREYVGHVLTHELLHQCNDEYPSNEEAIGYAIGSFASFAGYGAPYDVYLSAVSSGSLSEEVSGYDERWHKEINGTLIEYPTGPDTNPFVGTTVEEMYEMFAYLKLMEPTALVNDDK